MRLPLTRALARIEQEHKDVTVFRGLNNLPRRVAGEMSAMENCGTRFPGVLGPRAPRRYLEKLTTPNALFIADNGVRCTVDGTSFKYGGVTKGTVSSGRKSMCDFYGKIIIMPDKKYYDYKTDTFATLGTGATYPAAGGVPDMDKVYAHSNRVWGFKGYEVFASKHMDATIWNQFSVDEDGISTPMDDDSYHAELNAHYGSILGMAPAENHMCIMTQHSTFEVFGDRPLNYDPRLVSSNKGTVDGRSMVSIDGRVYSASFDGFTQYAGSHPRQMAYQLDQRIKECVSGTDGRRYYASTKDYNNLYHLYVYDTALSGSEASAWYEEDDILVIDFAMSAGFLYALDYSGNVWKFGDLDGYDGKDWGGIAYTDISWTAETDDFDYGYLGNTTVPKIKFEAKIAENAFLEVYLSVDDGTYFKIADVTGDASGATKFYTTYIMPQRGTRFKIKFHGHGASYISKLVREVAIGSDVLAANVTYPSPLR